MTITGKLQEVWRDELADWPYEIRGEEYDAELMDAAFERKHVEPTL